MTELKVGDRIQHKHRKKKNPAVVWKVIEVIEWKFYTMVRIRSERTGLEVTRKLNSFGDYRPAGFIKPVKDEIVFAKGNRFTYKDKVFIANNHGILSNERIGELLGRDKSSIAHMAHRMRKSKEFDMKETEAASNIRMKNNLIVAFETLEKYCTGTKCGECLIKGMCQEIRTCNRLDEIIIDDMSM